MASRPLFKIVSVVMLMLLYASVGSAKVPDIVIKQKRSVVTVYINDSTGKPISSGSGFIVDPTGIIATNQHVIAELVEHPEMTSIVKMENGAYFPVEKVLSFDKENDVALLKVDAKELPVMAFSQRFQPKQGDDVFVIGSPLGLETTISDGIISGIRGKTGFVQITAPISPGSSGSPVLNSHGEVIGVATFVIEGGQSLNFAVPVRYVVSLLNPAKYARQSQPKATKSAPAPTPPSAQKPEPRVPSLPEPAASPPPSPETSHTTPVVPPPQEDMVASLCRQGDSFLKGRAYDGALDAYDKAIALDPANARPYLGRGVIWMVFKHDYQQSLRDLDKALELNPGLADGYAHRCGLHTQLGNNGLAMGDCAKAIDLSPRLALAYAYRGGLYYRLNNKTLALEDLDKAIELAPRLAVAYCSRCEVRRALNDVSDAMRDCDKAIELDPRLAVAYNNRGNISLNRRDYKEALKDLDKAIELDPRLAHAYCNRASVAYNDRGFLSLKRPDYKQMLNDLDKAIELDPRLAVAYYNRAMVHEELRNKEDSVRDFKIAAKLGVKAAQDVLVKRHITW